MPVVEIATFCIVIGSLFCSSVNTLMNWRRDKNISLKKYSRNIFIDKSIRIFINLAKYLNNNSENYPHKEIITIKNDTNNLTYFIPSQKIIIDEIEFIPIKITSLSSISGLIITSNNLQKIEILFENFLN